MKGKITVLVLAAGSSTRMGQIKQLLPWAKGTLLEKVIKNAKTSGASNVLVVAGANYKEIKATMDFEGVEVIVNRRWATGLGSSVACGMHHILTKEHQSEAVLIVLADQPLMDRVYLNRLMEIYTTEKFGIVATEYKSGPGVPALFDRKYFEELTALNGDYGAKHILNKYVGDSMCIGPEGRERDIDTIEDYEELLKDTPEEE